MKETSNSSDQQSMGQERKGEIPLQEAGFIKFYGLYWNKIHVNWSKNEMLGQPGGWMEKGRLSREFKRDSVQMNFWSQKGVYVLYDSNLTPVYAGQAGLTRKNSTGGQSVGDRLKAHASAFFRNG